MPAKTSAGTTSTAIAIMYSRSACHARLGFPVAAQVHSGMMETISTSDTRSNKNAT